MFKKLVFSILSTVLFSMSGYAATLTVVDSAITTAINKQGPVDRISVYPADYGKLFCFTRIAGADVDTTVTHVWYYKEQEMARVTLPVRSVDWRTYSSKRFLPQWAGPWRVAVIAEDMEELTSISFVLE